MSLAALAAFCGIVLVASIVQGISGFAFGMVVLMVFPYIFGYTKALVLAGFMALFQSGANAVAYRKFFDKKWALGWVAIFTVMDLLSVRVLKKVGDDPIWYTLMGIIFIVMAIYLLWGQRLIKFKVNRVSMVVMASLCGIVMGAFGVGGPLLAAFFLEATKTKEEYLGTVQGLTAVGVGIDTLMRALNGMFTMDLFIFVGIGLVFMIIGFIIAKRLVNYMDALTLRKFICCVMVVNGIVMLSH